MKSKLLLILALVCTTMFSYSQKLSEASLIPYPQQIIDGNEFFEINNLTQIVIATDNQEVDKVAFYLEKLLNNAFPDITVTKHQRKSNYIILELLPEYDSLIGSEGYYMNIDIFGITISANTAQGLFYGVQTLRQLLPWQIETGQKFGQPVRIPTGKITDYPQFGYRSMMLDVARHFFGPDDIKKLIDYLVLFKINHLHLHLADDQGWRIEIKAYPKLTEIGGSSQVGGGPGGFYTQEEFKDLVKYAGARFVEIVPEIDMPGHTNAALASYDFLNCDGKKRDIYTGTRVGFSSLCTAKDTVYKFVDIVIGEIASLYPGKYFHIGGDESNATPHDEYLKFIDSIQRIVLRHGKTMIGWDEIAQTRLLPQTIVQFWGHKDFAQKAKQQGNKMIFSYAPLCYMDMKYNPSIKIGYKWAGYIDVDKAYNWRIDTLSGFSKDDFIGIEAPLWTETVKTLDDVEFMTFPRICSYAEIGWTKPGRRDWESFRQRLAEFSPRFKALGINFYPSDKIPWK